MWHGGVRIVVPDEHGRVLLVRQHHEDGEFWLLPGGAIEADESSRDAAIREVMEETGLVVHIGRLLWHVEENSARGQRFVNFFLAEIIGGRPELGTDPERETQVMEELRFFSQQEIAELPRIYPEYLRDELWDALKDETVRNPYKIRG